MIFTTKLSNLVSTATTVLLALGFLVPSVEAHGYNGISRNIKCKNGDNTSCGNIIYEPQSLEAPKGFPASGPEDGKLASAGIAAFSQLDEQTSARWDKTPIHEGPFTFTWFFTANHATAGYDYYITKAGWNPNQPLSRDQFDLAPFCSVNLGGARPPIEGDSHTCNVPARNGYHVILAVWVIGDTVNAFYNAIDVYFDGSNATPTSLPTANPTLRGTSPPTATPIATSTPAPTTPPTQSPTTLPTQSPTPLLTEGTPTINGGLCSSGLVNEAVDGCTAFVACDNGAVVPNSKIQCPGGLLFDNSLQICDWDFNVDCDENPQVPTETPVATPPSSPLCSSGSPLEPVENCAAFVHCLGGNVIPNSKVYCPAGLLFDVTNLTCDYAVNVSCP